MDMYKEYYCHRKQQSAFIVHVKGQYQIHNVLKFKQNELYSYPILANKIIVKLTFFNVYRNTPLFQCDKGYKQRKNCAV